MDIVRLTGGGDDLRSVAAKILTAAFSHIPVWSTITEARAEVDECCAADRVAFGVTADGELVGWFTVLGVIPDADGPGKHDILMAKRVGHRSK